jgi:hypothetical protein
MSEVIFADQFPFWFRAVYAALANAQPSLDLVTLCNKGLGRGKLKLGRKTSPPFFAAFWHVPPLSPFGG